MLASREARHPCDGPVAVPAMASLVPSSMAPHDIPRFARRDREKTTLLLSCAATVLSVSTSAWAEEAKTFPECTHSPTESDRAAAMGAFEAGNASYQEADYDRAILYWEDAFRRDCTALGNLLNLARAYQLAGQKENAVVALQTYLERKPNAEDADKIARRIEVLQGQIEEERQEAQSTAATAPAPTSTDELAQEPPPAEPRDRAPEPSAPVWPLVVAGGGLTVGVVGAVLWATNQSTINQCRQIESGVYECPSDGVTREAEAAQGPRNLGMGLAIGGAALAIGGTITYFVLKNRRQPAIGWTPSVGPGFAGLTYGGAF